MPSLEGRQACNVMFFYLPIHVGMLTFLCCTAVDSRAANFLAPSSPTVSLVLQFPSRAKLTPATTFHHHTSFTLLPTCLPTLAYTLLVSPPSTCPVLP